MNKNQKAQNKRILTLEELSNENKIIIFDTSALSSPIGKDHRELDFNLEREEKFYFMKQSINFSKQLNKYVRNGSGIYITEKIKKEFYDENYEDSRSKYKKKSKNNCGEKKSNFMLNFHRLVFNDINERKKLVNSFEEQNKILYLTKKEQKTYFSQKDKYLYLVPEYNVGDTDFDILMKGLAKAIRDQPTIIVSNDYGILRARNQILKTKYSITENQLEFYDRIDFFEFEKKYNGC